jgi:carbonic anhydrase/acetyltransferase-like protein (isoleucine patch superfamily)
MWPHIFKGNPHDSRAQGKTACPPSVRPHRAERNNLRRGVDRGQSGTVSIGANCVVMDTAVRGVRGNPLTIGDNVLVGPRAYLTGCAIEAEVFIATGATIFNGARIGRRAEVRINGIVHLRTALPEGATVPLGWIAVGDPAEILPPHEHERIWAIQKALDFPRYVFGVERPAADQSIMPQVMQRYAKALQATARTR